MKTPTISEIKRLSAEKSPYYFSRSTLQFFGQTMRDFHVRKSPTGRIFVYAPARDNGRFMFYSFREFIPSTGELSSPEDKDSMDNRAAVLDFISRH